MLIIYFLIPVRLNKLSDRRHIRFTYWNMCLMWTRLRNLITRRNHSEPAPEIVNEPVFEMKHYPRLGYSSSIPIASQNSRRGRTAAWVLTQNQGKKKILILLPQVYILSWLINNL